MAEGCPEPLERFFQQVEEESERRAQQGAIDTANASPEGSIHDNPGSATMKAKSRRRASISISRFGQLQLNDLTKGPQGPPTPQRITTLASQSPFYQAQITNGSVNSFVSDASGHLNDDAAHREEDNHVTQMRRIAGRQSISKAVGGFLPRRLSRSRSANVVLAGGASVVIGVSVEEATVESKEDEGSCASVHAPHALRSRTSKPNMTEPTGPNSSWAAKAKGFTQKFRRKSKSINGLVGFGYS